MLGVAVGDVARDALLVPEPSEEPEGAREPLPAVDASLIGRRVDGRHGVAEPVEGDGIGYPLMRRKVTPGRAIHQSPDTTKPPPRSTGAAASGACGSDYSHSMVPGGLLVTSRTTRLTSATSLVMRVEILASTSYGSRDQSAVMASSEETGRSTIGWP